MYIDYSQLVVTMEHLLVMKEEGRVATRRPLSSVVKITSKKKHPDLITFKFGHTTEDGQPEITDMDRSARGGTTCFVYSIKYFVEVLVRIVLVWRVNASGQNVFL